MFCKSTEVTLCGWRGYNLYKHSINKQTNKLCHQPTKPPVCYATTVSVSRVTHVYVCVCVIHFFNNIIHTQSVHREGVHIAGWVGGIVGWWHSRLVVSLYSGTQLATSPLCHQSLCRRSLGVGGIAGWWHNGTLLLRIACAQYGSVIGKVTLGRILTCVKTCECILVFARPVRLCQNL